MYKLIVGVACLVSWAGVVQAYDVPDVSMQGQYWQTADPVAAWDDYQRSVAINRTIVRRGLRDYADRVVQNTGKYGMAVSLLGAAAASTVTDTRLQFGESSRFTMELHDSTSDDRAVLVRFRQSW